VKSLRIAIASIIMMATACVRGDDRTTERRVGDQPRPNIILVIGDDHGWPYYGFQQSPHVLTNGQNVQHVVQTPHLDALAATGLTFARGYATDSVCEPSLQTLLSAHGHEWSQWRRLVTEIRSRIPMSTRERLERRENRYADNLPRRLGRQRYRTWEGGKLWAGLVADAGFDDGLATFIDEPPFFLSGGWNFGREGWSTAECGSTASTTSSCPALAPFRDFLDSVGDQPFFAWFAPMLPHLPYDAPPEYRAPLQALRLQTFEVNHLSNIRWFDEIVGELLEELDARGLRGNTLLIYVADNGWGLGLQSVAGDGRGKNTLYDLGFRTPVIFNQAGVVPAGVALDDFVSFSDLPATILDYAGAPVPPNSMGVSLRSRIDGGPPIGRSGLAMFCDRVGGAWVDDQWRYLQFDDGREELYRIDLDPFEQKDVAAQHPDKVAQYRALVDARRAELMTTPEIVEVTGQIRDAVGRPVAGGRVELRGSSHRLSSLTGEGGWFRFAGVEPSPRLRLRGSRGLRLSLLDPTSIVSLRFPFTSPGLFNPLLGTESRPVEGPLGGSISGRVITPSGVPIPDASLKASARLLGTDVALATVSRADGAYAFENLPAATGYRLRAGARGYRRATLEDLEIGSPADRVVIDVVLELR
jgi:arylsulfatase A-like enzyme